MAPLGLKKIAGNTYYIPAPTIMGLYVVGNRATLIDSGNDREAGRQILKLLDEHLWELDLIVNTHSNADHIGGNAFLQKRTGCRIAATRLESAFIQDPVLESAFLFGGHPHGALQNKFLMARPSRVTDIIPTSGPILDTRLEAFPLPGHFLDMIGIATPDNVLFLADCLFPEPIIKKYHVFFLYDLRAHFDTLKRVLSMEADCYVLSHGGPMRGIAGLVETNRRKIEEILGFVESCCSPPSSVCDIVQRICDRYHLELNPNQHVLVSSTIKSYLSYLNDEGRLKIVFTGGQSVWEYA